MMLAMLRIAVSHQERADKLRDCCCGLLEPLRAKPLDLVFRR